MPLAIVRQDITSMQADAIVNPTNREMVGFSGIDFAVHEKAGEKFCAECRKKAPLCPGEAKITDGIHGKRKHFLLGKPVVPRGNERHCHRAAPMRSRTSQCRLIAIF